MNSRKEFKRQYNCLKKIFEKTNGVLPIDGGRSGYNITKVNDKETTIMSGNTPKNHKVQHLQALFDPPHYFLGPRNNMKYTRDTRYGDLRMKNAIVDFLEKIDCEK